MSRALPSRDPRIVEGVPWWPFLVRYTVRTPDGAKRRRMVRWSPGFPWVREEIARELVDRFGLDGIAPGSVTIQHH